MFLLAGLLFGTSASLARERPPVGSVNDLPGLITARDSQVRELTERAEELREDEVLYGECLGGALYWNDFENLARRHGFADLDAVHTRRQDAARLV